ncbi:MAG TPA: hypothetical protein VHG72_16005 [Polyangia bacterium]|nr:hypothetical protein [Polyangia bacterium]
MKRLSLMVAPGILALGLVSVANADPMNTTDAPNPVTAPSDAQTPSGAVTTPSGTETPPPATYDNGMPGTPPGTPPVAPAQTPAPQTPSGATTETVLPPPPNGQVTEGGMVAPVVPVTPVAVTPVTPEGYYMGPSHIGHFGVGLLVGGGFQDFTGGIRNFTGDGGYWTARVVAGTRQYVGFEAAYNGDARSISALGLGGSSRLISNGVSGNLRLNVPIANGPMLIEPFGFVGIGWQYYQVTNNNTALSDIGANDNVLTLPFGGGLEFAYRGLLLDARYTYTQTYYNNLVSTNNGALNNWGVGGQVGFEF